MKTVTVKIPLKYVFSYFYELGDGDELVNNYNDYVNQCEEEGVEIKYEDYINYTENTEKPSSGLPNHYHGSNDGFITNYIDTESISDDLDDSDLMEFNLSDSEIIDIYEITEEMIGGKSLSEEMIGGKSLSEGKLSKDDLGKYALFFIDGHHRILSAIESGFNYIYVKTSYEELINTYENI